MEVDKPTDGQNLRSILKRSALAATKTCGVFAVMRRALRKRLLVLCYHSVISDDSPQDPRTIIAVATQQFESQLQILRDYWKPISLAELDAAIQVASELPDYSVLVTFDDGFRNNIMHAAPLLGKHGIPAIVFLTTGLIGTTDMLWSQEVAERQRHQDVLPEHVQLPGRRLLPLSELKRLPDAERLVYLNDLRTISGLMIDSDWQRELYTLMDWDEVRQLRSFGVEVGAHTVSHPVLASLTTDEVRRELSASKTKIEQETGSPCFAIAYPYGGGADFTAAVMEECRKLGFRIGFNLIGRRNPPLREMNPLSINRVCVTRDVSLIEFERMLCLSR